MDSRTMFYLDCLKLQVGLSQKVIPHSNLKDFVKTTQSDQYNAILNSGGIFIGKGAIEDTWVAIFDEPIDEDDHEEIELVFDRRPTKKDVQFVQFLLSIEDYLSDPRIKPYVTIEGVLTHWTLLPFETAQEKWEHYILMRDEENVIKTTNKRKT
ncbi:hypothetical protein ACFVS2_25280 [Brevibacillus sp. NPDC058079]|uniref:hypothetical protein n=1 Tax=Brevibacillus sp. NPDC058079 TaxID=3346330 RepID=UPI0036E70EA9